MSKATNGLCDEGEVTLSMNFTPDVTPKYRIVFPATESSDEVVYNVNLLPTTDPNVMNMHLENGAFVGTISKPEPTT